MGQHNETLKYIVNICKLGKLIPAGKRSNQVAIKACDE